MEVVAVAMGLEALAEEGGERIRIGLGGARGGEVGKVCARVSSL